MNNFWESIINKNVYNKWFIVNNFINLIIKQLIIYQESITSKNYNIYTYIYIYIYNLIKYNWQLIKIIINQI